MISTLNRQQQGKFKQHDVQIAGLTTAQLTIRQNNNKTVVIDDNEIQKGINQADKLLKAGQPLQAVNKLRKLRQSIKGTKNKNLQITVCINLGVAYYQVGFLQEAYEQLLTGNNTIKEIINKIGTHKTKIQQKMGYQILTGKLELQTCILFSQMGKHELALEHAKLSCKIHYNLIYDTLTSMYNRLNSLLFQDKSYNKDPEAEIKLEKHTSLLNNIAILTHLIKITKDLKLNFFSREKATLLSEQVEITKKYGRLGNRISIEILYSEEQDQFQWVYKNKILDQIQLKALPLRYFQETQSYVHNFDIIQRITFLAISLYCFSTETRFLEKNKCTDGMDVLDSQHWLSRSLEIAYMFMPPQAPILNQILTVHDRFHGIDKQTIPEDKQVTGFFKVLRPLTKPKSLYSSKSPMCSPILIRIQASKLTIDVSTHRQQSKQSTNSKKIIELDSNTIDLESLTKNNKIRGIGNPKILNFIDLTQTSKKQNNLNKKVQANINHIKNVYSNRKSSLETKNDKLNLNFSELNAKFGSTQQTLKRPHSYDRQINLIEESTRLNSQRKKKVITSKKRQVRRPISNSTTLKLDGFQLMPSPHRKIEENSEAFQFFQKINDNKISQAAKGNGNVFINNNINLFISKDDNIEQVIAKKNVNNRTSYHEISRRQNFMNKRKANLFNTQEK